MEAELETRTHLEEDVDRRLVDGLRILARIIARAYLDSHRQVGKREEIAGKGRHGIQRTS
jgi:hypothetical protein